MDYKRLDIEQEMKMREVKDNYLKFLNIVLNDLVQLQVERVLSVSAEKDKELVLAKANLEGARRLASDFNRLFLDFSKTSRK